MYLFQCLTITPLFYKKFVTNSAKYYFGRNSFQLTFLLYNINNRHLYHFIYISLVCDESNIAFSHIKSLIDNAFAIVAWGPSTFCTSRVLCNYPLHLLSRSSGKIKQLVKNKKNEARTPYNHVSKTHIWKMRASSMLIVSLSVKTTSSVHCNNFMLPKLNTR